MSASKGHLAENETINPQEGILIAEKSIPKPKEEAQPKIIKDFELQNRDESNDYAVFGVFILFCFS